jgi:mRNA interferase RelE/StbE
MASKIHRLRVPDEVASLIRSMHPQLKRKIRAALQVIQTDAGVGKALRDELAGLRSYRVGRFRIIYRVGSGPYIDIVTVGPRKRIYQETYRLIRRQLDPADGSG